MIAQIPALDLIKVKGILATLGHIFHQEQRRCAHASEIAFKCLVQQPNGEKVSFRGVAEKSTKAGVFNYYYENVCGFGRTERNLAFVGFSATPRKDTFWPRGWRRAKCYPVTKSL